VSDRTDGHYESNGQAGVSQHLAPVGKAREPRQFVKYTFFAVEPAWRRLPVAEREAGKAEFAHAVEECAAELLVLRSYSLVGLHINTDFMVWSVSDTLEEQQRLLARLNATALGAFLHVTYSYLAMTKRSQYVRDHRHEGQEGTRLTVQPGGAKYLFVYPLDKKREWYALPFEERNRAMREHIKLGHKYPSVKINTSYSFGLDDQEFVVAFESDWAEDFLDLVEELRGSVSSGYTLRDVPIFTCLAQDIRAALDALGGAPVPAGVGTED
jgi:chlorite dismutase